MVRGSRALPKQIVIEVEGGSRPVAPKGPMTYAFTHEEIYPSSSSDWDLGLLAEALVLGFTASGLRFWNIGLYS